MIPLHRRRDFRFITVFPSPLPRPSSLARPHSFWGEALVFLRAAWWRTFSLQARPSPLLTTAYLALAYTTVYRGLSFYSYIPPLLQEGCKPFQANRAVPKCLTDVTWWRSLKHRTNAIFIILTIFEKKGFLFIL